MRVTTLTVLTLLLALSNSATGPAAGADVDSADVDNLLVASAAEAAVVQPRRQEISDHYGDPSRFVKYIIRRPPVLV